MFSEERGVSSIYLFQCEILSTPVIARPAAPLHSGNRELPDDIAEWGGWLEGYGLLDRIKQLVSRYGLALRYFVYHLLHPIYRQTLRFEGNFCHVVLANNAVGT